MNQVQHSESISSNFHRFRNLVKLTFLFYCKVTNEVFLILYIPSHGKIKSKVNKVGH